MLPVDSDSLLQTIALSQLQLLLHHFFEKNYVNDVFSARNSLCSFEVSAGGTLFKGRLAIHKSDVMICETSQFYVWKRNAVASVRHHHRIYCCVLIIVGLEIQSCINSIKVSFACLQEKQRNFSKYITVKWCVNWKA